jgi:LuxR family maltose regulon positive regulatory protein
MPETLLRTKLFVPPLRPKLVPRPHLIRRLNQGLRPGCKLVLVSAPAGYGKTTLLSEWIVKSDLASSAAWLSIDQDDNDPRRFWSYILAAIQVMRPGTGAAAMSALQLDKPLSIKLLLTNLINELAVLEETLILILDDLHLINEPQIHDQLAFFLDHVPLSSRIVVSSRASAPWPIARMRTRREIVELLIEDLRFTLDESAALLNKMMGLGLSAEDLSILDVRTDGWIAGLQMAALSLINQEDRSGFVRAFSGTHRYVLDYLIEEVLDRQPVDMQKFLLKSSILDRLTGPLCDAIMEADPREQASLDITPIEDIGLGDDRLNDSPSSQKYLEQLEDANLFIVPLDDQRSWYRYHHLFADLLRARLSQDLPDIVDILHQRASAWFENQGLVPEAIKHAVSAGDLDTVERLIAGNVFALIHQRNLDTVASWLDSLPGEAIQDRPWLRVAMGWVLVYSGPIEELGQLLKGLDLNEDRRLSGHVAAMSSLVASYKGEKSRAVIFARQALAQLPKDEQAARGFTIGTLAYLLLENGELSAAAETLEEAIAVSKAKGDATATIMTQCDLAGIQFTMGNLAQSTSTCHEAMTLGRDQLKQRREGRPMPVAGGCAFRRMSQVLQERNDLDGALYHAKEHIRLYEQGGWFEGLIAGSIRLADVYRSLGDLEHGHEAIQTARRLAGDYLPETRRDIDAHEARMWLAEGDLAAASSWASGFAPSATRSFQNMFPNMVLARIFVAQNKLEEALGLIRRLLVINEEAGAGRYVIELLLLQALARQLRGDSQQALASIERALTLAEPEGYIRSFVEPGPMIAELLRGCIAQGKHVVYLGKLLDAFEAEERVKASLHAVGWELRDAGYLDPLSQRELEVLRLMTTSLTQREIADQLFISVNTLRSHVKSIYSKLDVHNRMESVRRAQDLGLLG